MGSHCPHTRMSSSRLRAPLRYPCSPSSSPAQSHCFVSGDEVLWAARTGQARGGVSVLHHRHLPSLEPGPAAGADQMQEVACCYGTGFLRAEIASPPQGSPGPRRWLLAPPHLCGFCLLRKASRQGQILSSRPPAAPGPAPWRPRRSVGHRCRKPLLIPKPHCLQGKGMRVQKHPQDRQIQQRTRRRVTDPSQVKHPFCWAPI